MTPRDISHSTGISRLTVYRHLREGWLPGRFDGTRWHIDAEDVILWAYQQWAEKRCTQYPPDYTRRFIAHFKLR